MEANLGDEKLGLGALPKLTNPSGKAMRFDLAGEVLESVEGVIIFQHMMRGYWSDPNPSGKPPECGSPDGKIGRGIRFPGDVDEAHECETCIHAQWGSSRGDDGEPGRGQACKQNRAFYLVRQGEILPTVVTVPPSSLGAALKLLAALTAKAIPYWRAAVKIGLEKAQNREGTTYGKLTFSLVEVFEGDDAREVDDAHRMFRKLFAGVSVEDMAAETFSAQKDE